MKKLTRKLRGKKNERGQGAIEYILLLVVVVSVGFMFKKEILAQVGDKLKDLSGGLSAFQVQQ